MTSPNPYATTRHKCLLPKLNIGMTIIPAGTSGTCTGCGNVWVVLWVRDQGGETQPQWVTDTSTPAAGVTPVPFLTRLASVAAKFVTVHRVLSAVPAIADGAAAFDVTTTWPSAFTDASYAVEVVVPPALVGKLTVAVKSQTAAAAVLTVTPTALVVTGSTLDVTAVRYA